MIANIYLCTFKSTTGTRELKIVSTTFGRAACSALDLACSWDDCDSFELVNIHLSDVCILNDKFLNK